MILFPAIDLKEGQVVRLERGDMGRATVFNDHPGQQASLFQSLGFSHLHVVDLDGAFAGQTKNAGAVEEILKATKMPVQLGGGIRTLEHIENWLNRGVWRVILGTIALRQPDLVKEACRLFPNQVVVGIDSRNGYVAVEGWAETSSMPTENLAREFEDCGVCAIVYTDIDRDGTLEGLNLSSTMELASAVDIPVIASGGIASMDDIVALARPECSSLAGAICGRALYDGRIDPKLALELLKSAEKGVPPC